MKRLAIAAALASTLLLAGCGEDGEIRALEAYGFTDITLGGYPWFSCGKDDSAFFSHQFTATNPKGQRIEGVVCGAQFKGYTVRFN